MAYILKLWSKKKLISDWINKTSDIQLLQDVLNDFFPNDLHLLKLDGIFGPKTRQKVMKFQALAKNLKVDGIVGPKTFKVLSDKYEKLNNSRKNRDIRKRDRKELFLLHGTNAESRDDEMWISLAPIPTKEEWERIKRKRHR